MKTLQIKISGQVQGVGFRWCAYEKFVELGLTGKAENAKEGGVEIKVTGEDPGLEQFLEWAKQGPPGAKVENIETLEIPLENFDANNSK